MLSDADAESSSRDGALAEDNKRLQEMLHAALRREAEALRRVKHLSELLGECRVNCGTPSSGPERRLTIAPISPVAAVSVSVCCAVADGVALDGGRLDWETPGTWEASESLPHSQVSHLSTGTSIIGTVSSVHACRALTATGVLV